MERMNHRNWYARLTDNEAERAAALRAGVTPSTLHRQLAADHLSAENVIALARAYGENPARALAATGHLDIQEITEFSVDEVGELLTDQQLIRLLALRIDADPQAWFGTFGELADEDAEVIDLGVYAADSSPDEPEEGDEGFGEGP